MYMLHSQIHGAMTSPPILSPYSSSYSSNYQKQSSSPPSDSFSSGSRISPAILFIIIILAVLFFILGFLHLLVRFLTKQRSSSSSSISQSNRHHNDMTESDAYQRQLQQLFYLHDSGLDQAFIDALPVFLYKEIIGLKEPFDCAVCLCEFLEQDKLRLLPNCNHAFHIDCIDTWLLSNSTCPLCRGTLYAPGFTFETPLFFDYFEGPFEEDGVSGSVGSISANNKQSAENHIMNGKRVFSVRLGKFRSSNNVDGVERIEGESSSSNNGNGNINGNLDVRRCYSMGSYQYVVADSDLRVALCPNRGDGGISGSMRQLMKGRIGTATNGNCSIDGDVEGKKISIARKGDSFSVSKIWQWSKKDKLTSSSETNFHNNSIVTANFPWINKARGT